MGLTKIYYHQFHGNWKENIKQSPFSVDDVGFDIEKIQTANMKNALYSKCPAWNHRANRVFSVKSPIDILLLINTEEKRITSNIPQWQFDEFTAETFENEEWCTEERTTIQLTIPRFLFWTNDKNVWLEQRPTPFTAINNNLVCTNAWFNISSWNRPISFAFDVVDTTKPIKIKRGDVLFELCFYPKNLDNGILLEKQIPSDDFIDNVGRNLSIKRYLKGFSSSKIFKDTPSKSSKCPFSFLFKN